MEKGKVHIRVQVPHDQHFTELRCCPSAVAAESQGQRDFGTDLLSGVLAAVQTVLRLLVPAEV